MQAVIASIPGPYYLSSLSPALPCQWCPSFQASRAYCSSPLLPFLLCSCLYLKTSLLFFQDLFQILHFPWGLPWQLWPTKSILMSEGPRQLSMATHWWDVLGQEPYPILLVCKANLACHPLPPTFTRCDPPGNRTKQYTCNLSVRCGLAWALANQVYKTSKVTLGLFAHFGFGSALCWAFLFGEKITLMRGLTVVPQVLCLACGVLGVYNMQWGNARKWLLVFHDN